MTVDSPVAVGAAVPRTAARRFVAGRGRYTDDVRVPGLLHAAFLRSPFAHARIASLDLSEARRVSGVVAVYDGRDIGAVCRSWTTHLATFASHRSAAQPPLAVGRALWQGQPVAIVVAETRAGAEDAVAAIRADWDELEPLADAALALADGAQSIHAELGGNLAYEHHIATGAVDEAFAGAYRVIRRRLRFARHTGVPLEGRAVIAEFDPGTRQLTVHQSTQVPHQMRAVYAQLFGLAEVDVRVLTPDVGGGFGLKLHVYDDEMAAVAAAVLLARPVKFACDRFEAFSSDVHARSHEVEAAIAVDAQGTILAFAADDLADIGAYSVYPRSSVLEGVQALAMVGAPYAAPALRGRLRVAYQNKALVGAYRGVGQPVACAITEMLVDAAAAELAIDPAEMRRRNYRNDNLHGTISAAGMDMGGLSHQACLGRLLELMQYDQLRAEQHAARAQGRYLGIGLAAFVETTAPGAGFYGAAGVPITAQDGCSLRLEPSGEITCLTSSTDQGQGVETGIQQLVAAAMTLPLAAVRIVRGDTLATPVGGGAWASRGLTVGGEAALTAAQALRQRLATVAAAVLGVAADRLLLADGAFAAEGRRISLRELAALLHYRQHELPPGVSADATAVAVSVPLKPFLAANGIQASLVEIDPDSGFITLLKHWVVEDCGRVVNPLLADEQLRGGVVQGLGAAFYEECRYDARGQLLTSTMADYLVPMAGEMPDIVIAHIETPVSGTLLGGKGVGEAGTIGAGAAAANAVNDALAPFDCVLGEQPFTPERVLRALGRVA
ncbi:MAG: xanthine dehydrogenase family protein molybdopterin-binding subunit, partial [Proteobacteria bacterium]|nr:xanthine dehydrogenase family protein molybdopterin-binding subunit [Pseudomonadota bacterium]